MKCDLNRGCACGQRERGFTLVEAMVVVAIIGILAAIAYPAYTAYLVKARRSAAVTCLQQNAQFLERHYTTNLSYAGATGPEICDPDLADYYTFTYSVTPAAKVFTIQAAPTSRQNDPECGALTLNQQGVRTEGGAATSAAACW